MNPNKRPWILGVSQVNYQRLSLMYTSHGRVKIQHNAILCRCCGKLCQMDVLDAKKHTSDTTELEINNINKRFFSCNLSSWCCTRKGSCQRDYWQWICVWKGVVKDNSPVSLATRDKLHKCDAHLQHSFTCKTNMIIVELAIKSKIILNVRNKKKHNKTTVGYKSDKYTGFPLFQTDKIPWYFHEFSRFFKLNFQVFFSLLFKVWFPSGFEYKYANLLSFIWTKN